MLAELVRIAFSSNFTYEYSVSRRRGPSAS